MQVTDAVFRADQVRRDPAVIKSSETFRTDLRQAAHSGAAMLHEVRSAWIHADGRPTTGTAPTVA